MAAAAAAAAAAEGTAAAIVVTGANKGIGLEVVRRLLDLTTSPVVLTARSAQRGREAIKYLTGGGARAPDFCVLDVTSKRSCDRFGREISARYAGGVIAVVNNAGIAFAGDTAAVRGGAACAEFSVEAARQTMDVNYRGTRRATEALLPCLRKAGSGARIINVSSQLGTLEQLSAELQARFSAPDLTLAQLDALVDEFVADIRAGNHEAKGWSNSMYGVSKLACTAYTRILARDEAEAAVAAIACCPGWCQTDLSRQTGPRTAAKGAETPAELARLPLSELEERGIKSGGFYQDMKPKDWHRL